MNFIILRPSHSHIQGKVSFYLVKQDPYNHYAPVAEQLFKEKTPQYHLDYFGKFPETRKDDKFPEKYIISELKRKFDEMLIVLKKQIDRDEIYIFKGGKLTKENLGFFTIK